MTDNIQDGQITPKGGFVENPIHHLLLSMLRGGGLIGIRAE